mmetsp:Transcript_38498/g.75609  ORF Transcript_38498/g.75609 Transcript_38498/m.75609 type:complete len:215 (-) Transcript_38498:1425-2069(-)
MVSVSFLFLSMSLMGAASRIRRGRRRRGSAQRGRSRAAALAPPSRPLVSIPPCTRTFLSRASQQITYCDGPRGGVVSVLSPIEEIHRLSLLAPPLPLLVCAHPARRKKGLTKNVACRRSSSEHNITLPFFFFFTDVSLKFSFSFGCSHSLLLLQPPCNLSLFRVRKRIQVYCAGGGTGASAREGGRRFDRLLTWRISREQRERSALHTAGGGDG